MNVVVKGWCPGALRPMPSGDGLLVRVKPWCSAFTLDQAAGLADIAARLGNGHVDLTRRANLQIRGLSDAAMPELHDVLDRLGLLDPDPQIEAARNIMVGPLAGAEARALAKSLTEAIAFDRRMAVLPAKFGWLVDDASAPTILDLRADIALCLTDAGVAVRRGERWLGLVAPDLAVSSALAVALGETPILRPLGEVPAAGLRPQGLTPPFGRLGASQLKSLVALLTKAGAEEIRLSPWRALHCDLPVSNARELGFIVDADDQLLRIDACPGAPACLSSSVDTRKTALKLAARGFDGTVHISGCAKGCARSAPADLVLVGDGGRYGVIRNGTARGRFERTVAPDEL
jgi:precorrin-3B synthase